MKRENLNEEVNFCLLFVIAFTLPFPNHSINNFFIILLCFNWFLEAILNHQKKFTLNLAFMPGLVLLTLYLIGLLYTDDIAAGLASIEKKVYLLFFWCVLGASTFRLTERQFAILLKVFVTSCIIVTLLNLSSDVSEVEVLPSWLGQPLYIAMFLSWSLVILCFLLERDHYKLSGSVVSLTLIVYVLFFVLGLSLFASVVSTALLSIGLIFVFPLLPNNQKVVFVTVTCLFAGCVSYNVTAGEELKLPIYNVDWQAATPDAGLKKEIWASSVEVISNNLFGVGTGDFQIYLNEKYQTKKLDEAITHQFNSHNQFLDTFGTIGVMGFLTLILIFVVYIYQIVVKWKSLTASFRLINVNFLILAISFLYIETLFARQKGVVFFSFFDALLLAQLQEKPKPEIIS